MIRILARGAVCVIACGALVLGSSAVPASSEQAGRDVTCATEPGSDPWYSGPSASKVYDDMFSDSKIDIPGLDAGFVPQGMALWNGMLLISAYLPNDEDDDTKAEKAARIFAVHAQTGNYVGSVAINPSHAGGVAVVDDWVFVQGPRVGPDDKFTVEKYMATHVMVGLTTPLDRISPMGEPQVLEAGASSFLATDGHTLYAGKHNVEKTGFMHEYDVAANGTVQQGRRYHVPPETQGLAMASGEWVYSTSYGRHNASEIHLLPDGEGNIGKAKCFEAPSMSEGIVAAHGSVYLLFESGAEPYDGARNPITTLHKVSIEELSDYGD